MTMTTTSTLPMLETYPRPIGLDRVQLAAAIDTIIMCSEACTSCADACLSEDMVSELTTCIRLNLDCAEICATTARVLTRQTGFDVNIARAQVEACATACMACAAECAAHAGMHEHCRVCAEACNRCERACRELLAALR
jgi:hypothetical protein